MRIPSIRLLSCSPRSGRYTSTQIPRFRAMYASLRMRPSACGASWVRCSILAGNLSVTSCRFRPTKTSKYCSLPVWTRFAKRVHTGRLQYFDVFVGRNRQLVTDKLPARIEQRTQDAPHADGRILKLAYMARKRGICVDVYLPERGEQLKSRMLGILIRFHGIDDAIDFDKL